MTQRERNSKIMVSVGKTLGRCESKELPREVIQSSLTSHKVGRKDSKWFVIGSFKNGRRSGKNLISRQDVTFDIDAGHTEEEIRKAVEDTGLEGLVYSTYSHGISAKEVSTADFDKWKATHPENPAESYLIEKAKLLPKIAANAREGQRKEGKVTLHHKPCPKWRVAFIAESPFKFNGADSIDQWKGMYRAVGSRLGLKYDKPCMEPARLFFVPRTPKNPPLPPKAWTVEGPALRFQDFEAKTEAPSGDPDQVTDEFDPFDVVDWIVNREKVKSALYSVDPSMGHNDWCHIGMALHNCSGGDNKALELWDQWSSQDPVGYERGLCAKKWNSFGKPSGKVITIGTLFKQAKAAGWAWEDAKNSTNAVASIRVSSMYDEPPVSGENLGVTMPKPQKLIFNGADGAGGIERGVVGIRAGQGGCGKTTVEVQICCSIASCVDCTFGAYKFETNGPVLALFAEDKLRNIEGPVYHLRKEVGKEIDLRELHIIPRRKGDPRFFVKDSGGNIIPTQGFEKFKKLVSEIQPVYVVIDSFSVTSGAGEISNDDGAFIMSCLSELCELGDNASVVALAHPNKTSISSKGQAGKNATPKVVFDQSLDPNSVRGSSALVFNSRWCSTMTLVPAPIRRKLDSPSGVMLTAYAARKTNYTRPLQLAYFQHDVRTGKKPDYKNIKMT